MLIDVLQDSLKRSGMTRQQLSEAIGKRPGYISDLFRHRRDPGASVFIDVCRVLGLSADEAAGLLPKLSMVPRADKESDRIAAKLMSEVFSVSLRQMAATGGRPSVDDVVAWWRRENGLLNDFDHLRPIVDLYEIPDAADLATKPAAMGQGSLAAGSFVITDLDELRSIARNLPADFRSRLVGSYTQAKERPVLSLERIDYDSDGGPKFGFDYTRALLPVQTSDGRHFILNYSKLLA